MNNDPEIWQQIRGRLNAAAGFLHLAAPEAYAKLESAFRNRTDQDEYEPALDALISGAEEAGLPLRRRFWEELLVAAMLMRLEKQFSHITSRIVNLEPHIFGPSASPPHLYCDFNGYIESDVYCLDGVGTALDAARLCLMLKEGLRLILYDADLGDNREPEWLLADAELVEYPGYGLVAKAEPGSYRWIKRDE